MVEGTAFEGNGAAPVGYLASQYPAVSHTFIRREIVALRAAGLQIRTYSVRQGTRGDETFTILAQSAFAFLRAHLLLCLSAPARYFGTFALALRHRAPGLRALVWSVFHFAEAILLAAQLKRDGIGRLHNHFANSAATVGMLAAHYRRIPWSVTLHGISEFEYPAGLLLSAKLERADFAACASYFVKAQAMRFTRPAIWNRLAVVRCGIDPADLPAKATDAVRSRGRTELICVARLSPEKGHTGLLATLGQLLQDGLTIHLTLVGDGPEEASLKALTRDLGLDEHVTFTGSLDEAATLRTIASADALVLTSFMEGLPVVLIEALALGLPVIASRVAGIPELVEDGRNGLLFTPGDWADLRETLRRLLTDAAIREHLSANARARVTEAFFYPSAATPMLPLLGGSKL